MTAEPGQAPTLPLITLEPVLVTVEPASTPKLPAVPRLTELAKALSVNNESSKDERANKRRVRNFISIPILLVFLPGWWSGTLPTVCAPGNDAAHPFSGLRK